MGHLAVKLSIKVIFFRQIDTHFGFIGTCSKRPLTRFSVDSWSLPRFFGSSKVCVGRKFEEKGERRAASIRDLLTISLFPPVCLLRRSGPVPGHSRRQPGGEIVNKSERRGAEVGFTRRAKRERAGESTRIALTSPLDDEFNAGEHTQTGVAAQGVLLPLVVLA